jgi:pyruvate,water dikinase
MMAEVIKLGNPLEQPQIGMDWVPSYWKFQPGDENRFWINDTQHIPMPYYPLDLDTIWASCTIHLGWASANFSIPAAHGNLYRALNGREYCAGNPIADPEEIGKRAAEFGERYGYYLTNWDQVWGAAFSEIEKWLEWMDSFDYEKDPDPKDPTQMYKLIEYFDRLIDTMFRIQKYHFEGIYLLVCQTIAYRATCKELVPGTTDDDCNEMLQGFGNKLIETDAAFWKLGELAVSLGVGDIVKDAPMEEVVPGLEKTDNGRKWLEELRKTVHDWGMRHVGGCMSIAEPSWTEDPSYPIAFIRGFMERAAKGEKLLPREMLVEMRERAIKEFRAKIETDEGREKFDAALRFMQKMYAWSEDHNFYVEGVMNTLFHLRMVELGRRLVNEGYIDEPYDIFYLLREELRSLLLELAMKCVEVRDYNRMDVRRTVKKRKEDRKKQFEWDFPVALGVRPTELPKDPVSELIYGATLEAIDRLGAPVEKPEEIVEIRGTPAAPGICEGTVRVLLDVSQLKEVQPGEILVCGLTNPMWSPVFGEIIGVVTDQGGTLSHAGIVSREYGIPAVVGTMNATKILRTGDRVRINGSEGMVTRIE